MKILAIVVCLMLASIALPALAEDGNNVSDQLGDIFSGKGNTYAGIEINNIPMPLIGSDSTSLTIWADAMIGEIDDDVKRDVRGGIRLAIDWDKLTE